MANKAVLVFRQKLTLKSGLLREAVIWRVPAGPQYPEGVKYRMVLVDPVNGKMLLLIDNHQPKGHHLHLPDGKEVAYEFTTIPALIDDFLERASTLEKEYENDEDKDQI